MCMKILRNLVALSVASLMVMNIVPMGLAHARMVTTDQVIDRTATAGDREKVETFLLREDVQNQLVAMGIDPAEAKSRVTGLSDLEIQQIAGRIDELPAGEGVGFVIGVILIVFLVLLITDLLGLTDVFPFVKKKAQ